MHRHSPRCNHRFRSTKPQLLLAKPVGFFGSGCSSGRPVAQITQLTSDRQILLSQPFQPSTEVTLNGRMNMCQRTFQGNSKISVNVFVENRSRCRQRLAIPSANIAQTSPLSKSPFACGGHRTSSSPPYPNSTGAFRPRYGFPRLSAAADSRIQETAHT